MSRRARALGPVAGARNSEAAAATTLSPGAAVHGAGFRSSTPGGGDVLPGLVPATICSVSLVVSRGLVRLRMSRRAKCCAYGVLLLPCPFRLTPQNGTPHPRLTERGLRLPVRHHAS